MSRVESIEFELDGRACVVFSRVVVFAAILWTSALSNPLTSPPGNVVSVRTGGDYQTYRDRLPVSLSPSLGRSRQQKHSRLLHSEHPAHHASHVLPQRGRRARLHAQGAAPRPAPQRSAPQHNIPPLGRTARLSPLPRVASQKETPTGKPTESAHPGGRLPAPARPLMPCAHPADPLGTAARFSPDDKFSKQRLICKKRFGLLPMQKPKPTL